MKKKIKRILLKIFPKLYNYIIFKDLKNINWENAKNKNIEYEMLLLKYFLDNKHDAFIDVGANLGKYLFLALKIIDRKNLYAFEPQNNLYENIKKMFGSSNIFNSALSNKDGIIEFKIPIFDGKEIHTRGKLNTHFIENEETDSKIYLVKVNKLDSYMNEFSSKKIKLIKIDVEGAEFEVLEGAMNIIVKHRPYLIVEIEQRHSEENILFKIKEFTKTNNYSTFIIHMDQKRLVNIEEILNINEIQDIINHAKNKLYINNFIFIPNENLKLGILEKINMDMQ